MQRLFTYYDEKQFMIQGGVLGDICAPIYTASGLGDKDRVFRNSTRDPKYRELLETPFVPIPDSPAGELSAKFDIVIGATPEA